MCNLTETIQRIAYNRELLQLIAGIRRSQSEDEYASLLADLERRVVLQLRAVKAQLRELTGSRESAPEKTE